MILPYPPCFKWAGPTEWMPCLRGHDVEKQPKYLHPIALGKNEIRLVKTHAYMVL